MENVKARPLGKLMECIVNGPNISQMVLRGFKLTINATTEAIFNLNRQFFFKCANNMHIEKLMQNFILTVDCVSNHIKLCYQVPRRKNFDFIFTCSEVKAQKIGWFLASWCQELSNGIQHEWFCRDNFRTLLYPERKGFKLFRECIFIYLIYSEKIATNNI